MRPSTHTWGVIRSLLTKEFSFGTIKELVGFTGLDVTLLSHLEQVSGGTSATKSQLLSAIDQQVGQMSQSRLNQFLQIIVEEMLRQKPSVESSLCASLEKLGWQLHQRMIIPIAVLDVSELPDLPVESHSDLIKAATKLRDGDLSGAISSACAAVDSVTSQIYRTGSLGNHGSTSFQERVSCSLAERKVLARVEDELIGLGWQQNEAKNFVQNLRGALNQAANVLQSLRSKMGDVHGTKPILKPLVFVSIKWASLIVRILS